LREGDEELLVRREVAGRPHAGAAGGRVEGRRFSFG
jgi:hypothetical protein